MSKELSKADPDAQADAVVRLMFKGYHPADIAKETGIPRGKVIQYIDTFNNWAHNVPDLKDRAKEVLAAMDAHYGDLIKRAYDNLDEIEAGGNESPAMYAQRLQALKLIANLEETRLKALQQAGLIDDVGDEVAELMEKNEILEKIIREVSAECPRCKLEVMRRLGNYTGKVEVVPDA